MKSYCVYVHTNKINGKQYVGITSLRPTQRWGNGSGYRRCDAFYNAIKKYGFSNFEHEILKDGLTKKEAEALEVKLIASLNTQIPNGYNIAPGGGATGGVSDYTRKKMSESHIGLFAGEKHPMYGRHHSEETKRMCSEKRKGHHMSAESREKLSKAKMGHPVSEEARKKLRDYHLGLKASDETREKMREHWKAVGGPSAKGVKQLTLDGVLVATYRSLTDAGRAVSGSRVSIGMVCMGKRKTAKGFRWEYA